MRCFMKKEENKTRRNIWLVSGFFLIVGVFVIFYSSISTFILGEFQFSNDLSPFIRQQALKDSFTPCWIMIFVGIIVALISLVLFVMKCGKSFRTVPLTSLTGMITFFRICWFGQEWVSLRWWFQQEFSISTGLNGHLCWGSGFFLHWWMIRHSSASCIKTWTIYSCVIPLNHCG